MWIFVALGMAFVSLVTCIYLASYVLSLSENLRTMNTAIGSMLRSFEQFVSTIPQQLTNPILEGKRIGLCIEQDHKLPVLETLIRERLEAEDAHVLDFEPAQADELEATTKWTVDDSHPDVLVRGKVQCNQYREVYYHADLTFEFANGVVASILENPPNGARQANLAIAVVQKIKQTLEQAEKKAERRNALSELNHS